MSDWKPKSAQPAEEAPWTPGSAVPAERRTFTGKEERAAEDEKLLESMGGTGRFVAGLGSGALNFARNLQDITTPDGPKGFRDAMGPDKEAWAQEQQDAELLSKTTTGMVGNVAGEMLPAMAMGGGVSGLAEGILPKALPGAAKALLPLGAEGMAQGAVLAGPGHRGEGAVWGGLLNAGFGAAGKVGRALRKTLGGKVAAAEAKAAELGARGALKQTLSARSAAGQEAQELYRTLEHLRELKASATPESLERLASYGAEGITPKSIEARLHGKSVAKLPGDVASADATAEAYHEALATEPARAGALADEAAKSSLGKDAWELFKMYGEPLVGAAAGSALMGLPGGAGGMLGGLMLGRTRAGKAIRTRLAKPGNQLAMAKAARGLFGGGGRVLDSGASAPLGIRAMRPSAPNWTEALADDEADPALRQLALAEALKRQQEGTP